MAKCIDVTPKRKKICVGALRNKIKIFKRVLTSSTTEGVAEHSEKYTLFKTLFSSIETIQIRTLQTLDGVTIDPELVVTHVFIVRFLATINAEQYIQFKGNNYKILKVENIDEADRWFRLKANLRGDLTLAGAQ